MAFSVRVSPEATVDDLKKLIKVTKAPSFVHIPADELKLVSVSIPYDNEQELEPIRLKSLVFKRPLRPIDNLREVFGDPVPRDSIHFIIDTRPIGALVKIDPLGMVDGLKKLIMAAKQQELDNIPADELELCS
ncbi:hypothetical protein BGZ81_007932, partial [Podila clonocystis]